MLDVSEPAFPTFYWSFEGTTTTGHLRNRVRLRWRGGSCGIAKGGGGVVSQRLEGNSSSSPLRLEDIVTLPGEDNIQSEAQRPEVPGGSFPTTSSNSSASVDDGDSLYYFDLYGWVSRWDIFDGITEKEQEEFRRGCREGFLVPWSPKNHRLFPGSYRRAARLLLLGSTSRIITPDLLSDVLLPMMHRAWFGVAP